jgi:predicted metalloprotease
VAGVVLTLIYRFISRNEEAPEEPWMEDDDIDGHAGKNDANDDNAKAVADMEAGDRTSTDSEC